MSITVTETIPSEHVSASNRTACWELAVKIYNTEITKDARKLLISTHEKPVAASLADIIGQAEAAQERLNQTSSKFGETMRKLVLIISEYRQSLDVIVQYDPVGTALVWGSIRALLMVAVKEIECSEEIGNAIMRLAVNLRRWDAYLGNYPESRHIQSTLARMFAYCIDFSVRATQYYNSKWIVRYIKAGTSPKRNKILRILDKIEELSAALERDIALESYEVQSQHTAVLNGIHSLVISSNSEHVALLTAMRTRNALVWLEETTPSKAPSDSWEQGTCEWISRHPMWKLWEAANCIPILWVYGIPGRGKSILAKYLAHHVRQKTSLIFTHFFRKTDGSISTKATAICTSILSQTIRQHAHVVGLPILDTILQTHIEPLSKQYKSCDECPFDKLWSAVEAVLSVLPEFALIIDAIDECSEDTAAMQLMKYLRTLSQSFECRTILLSRHNSVYAESLGGSICLEMDEKVVNEDILLFVEREAERHHSSLGPLKKELRIKVAEAAHGMFLWAKMMLEYLKAAPTLAVQRERLRRFPPGLSAMYRTFLAETGMALDEDQRSIRRQILVLTAGAARPLSVEEMVSALATKSSRPVSHENRLTAPLATIRQYCWPLLDCREESIRFIHASVQEYLTFGDAALAWEANPVLVAPISQLECQLALSHICLFHLSQRSHTRPEVVVRFLKHNILNSDIRNDMQSLLVPKADLPPLDRLYDYAASYWHRHIISLGSSITLPVSLLVQTFMQSPAFVLWAEYLYHARGLFDLGPVVTIRAEMKSWHQFLPIDLRSVIGIDSFLIESYQCALNDTDFVIRDPLLSTLLLYRSANFFNLTGANTDRLYAIRKKILEAMKTALQPGDPFLLRCTVELAIEEINNMRFDCAAELLQAKQPPVPSPSPDTPAYHPHHLEYYAESYLGLAMYHMLELDESIRIQTQAWAGLSRLLGATHQDSLKSQMFLAWALQAQGNLDEALKHYQHITKTWTELASDDHPITIMSQMGVSAVLRRLGHTAEALSIGAAALADRQRVLGTENNTATMDSALNMVLIYWQRGEIESAEAFLDVAERIGPGNCARTRNCQVARFRAMLVADKGDIEAAIMMLRGLIEGGRVTGGKVRFRAKDVEGSQVTSGEEGRELLWARYDLARLLRKAKRPAAALEVFRGLVETKGGGEVIGAEVTGEESLVRLLSVAEQVTCVLLEERDLPRAREILDSHGMRWAVESRYWLLPGGPYVER